MFSLPIVQNHILLNRTDPIAEVIGLLRPHAVVAGSLYATRPWAVRYEPFAHVKLGTVVRGECWLSLEGHEPLLLKEGDFYMLGNPPRYVMGSALTVRPCEAEPLWAGAENGTLQIGIRSDDATFVCGGLFSFDDPNSSLLLDILPVLVHVRAGDDRGKLLGHLSDLLVAEVGSGNVGRPLVLDHLAQIFLVYMLRAHANQPIRPVGWLGALGDARVGAALRAMHADVAHRWTLNELAGVARMSRSAFAASFKLQVGSAPLEYLIQWRMSLARDALRRDSRSIADLAFASGYESESAFSTAFRRVSGMSPKQFRDYARRIPDRDCSA
ncbi:AraC family transcriptional regulator [Caballeronia sordidicola]|uniref:AraC family transcriptional regulator n=1 Tax=Caballeronia sordidicola TaxID=196367 RepID=UPI000AF0F6E2|nr:AraC family transcriptional regulator [Caballeronia sordidicola]